MEDIKLYSEIEHLIIAWNIDGTKTAGSLTREIMELLNNERVIQKQKELLELAYNNFIYNPDYKANSVADLMSSQAGQLVKCPTIEDFINKCKTDNEFSEKWGLKIEERELNTQERNEWFQVHLNGNNPFMKSDWKDFELDQQNIPTKLITITYNNIKLERYE